MAIRKTSSGLYNPVMPVKGRKRYFFLAVFCFSIFMIATVYFSVLQIDYGKKIQQLKREVNVLASEKRDLEGQLAGMTSLSRILHQAQEMGMVYPRNTPPTLLVKVPEGSVPQGKAAFHPIEDQQNKIKEKGLDLALLRPKPGGVE